MGHQGRGCHQGRGRVIMQRSSINLTGGGQEWLEGRVHHRE